MRVVQYCDSFSLLSETAIYTWVTELQRQGVDCEVVAHALLNEEQRPFDPVHIVPRPRNMDWDRLGYKALELLGLTTAETSWYTTIHKRLERVLRQRRPDVLHAHFGDMAWMVAPVASEIGLPLIVTFHGRDISELVKQEEWRRRYRFILWPSIKFATVLSEEMREAVIRQGCPPEKVRIVRIGRDIEALPVREERSNREFSVVSVGRLTEKKGHADAIEVVARLVSEGVHIRFRIFGDGELRSELEERIAELQVGAYVSLEGAKPNDEVIDALRQTDAFLLCSKTASNGDKEGTPNVIVEAQGMAVPCVSTRHAGIPEMIPRENQWLLAEEGDIDGIASRLAKLERMTPQQRMMYGERGRAKMLQEYDLATECNKFRNLYREATE